MENVRHLGCSERRADTLVEMPVSVGKQADGQHEDKTISDRSARRRQRRARERFVVLLKGEQVWVSG